MPGPTLGARSVGHPGARWRMPQIETQHSKTNKDGVSHGHRRHGTQAFGTKIVRPRQGLSMSALIHTKTITVDGLSVRYAEGGQHGPDAILMSPWPEAYTPSSRPGHTSRPPRTWSPSIPPASADRTTAKR